MELSQTTVTLLRQLTFLSFLWLSGFFPIIIDSNFDWTETHVSRKSKWSIHESVTRCVTGCYVTSGTVENLSTLWGIVWGTEYGRFTSINISKVRSSSFDRNDSDGKASFKRQRSPETQRTHKMRVRVKCLYFEIFIVVNRPYCPGPQRWQTIEIWPLRYLSFSILKQPWEV